MQHILKTAGKLPLRDSTGHPLPFTNLTYGLATTKFLKKSDKKEFVYTGVANLNNICVHILESKAENIIVSTEELSQLFKLVP